MINIGLTNQSTGKKTLNDIYKVDKNADEFVIALAGNPNTGKSTVFNELTGLKQHTGNWPGKTVTNEMGKYKYNKKNFVMVDLPGTYSLFAASVEEEVARNFICFGNPDIVVVVTDATCIERNMNLVYQVMELTDNIILCVNLIDEAKSKSIIIDREGLEKELGIPVVFTAARKGEGINELKETIFETLNSKIKLKSQNIIYDSYIENMINLVEKEVKSKKININSRWLSLRLIDGDEKLINSTLQDIDKDDSEYLIKVANNIRGNIKKQDIRDDITAKIYEHAKSIRKEYITKSDKKIDRDRIIDNYITSKVFGIPIMIGLLAFIIWITVTGANYPSALIAKGLFALGEKLSLFFNYINAPQWLHDVLILGLYRTLAWVISVMLPPMAIFFPMFTLLEDLGYLPRVAFNLDHLFKKACAHGKQCLTMCMGLGCNAAGVIGCRIIESPRERLIAILTNNFVPCNGRFPTLLAIASVFLVANSDSKFVGIMPALAVTLMVIIGIITTLLVSYILSKTLLKGIPSSFTLELPPYRKPQIGRVIYTSIIDRTIFVLGRAVVVAIPAGIITWILANIYIGDLSILQHAAAFLQPFAEIIGLDGFILLAFILGLPANEIVIPILLMSYLSTGHMIEFESIESLRQILISNGWTYLTALNVMLFSLLHWPCATTLLTIKRETGSKKWTAVAALMPTAIAILVCFITTSIAKLFFM